MKAVIKPLPMGKVEFETASVFKTVLLHKPTKRLSDVAAALATAYDTPLFQNAIFLRSAGRKIGDCSLVAQALLFDLQHVMPLQYAYCRLKGTGDWHAFVVAEKDIVVECSNLSLCGEPSLYMLNDYIDLFDVYDLKIYSRREYVEKLAVGKVQGILDNVNSRRAGELASALLGKKQRKTALDGAGVWVATLEAYA